MDSSLKVKSRILYRIAKILAILFVLFHLILGFALRSNPPLRAELSDLFLPLVCIFGTGGLIYALLNANKQEKRVRLALALMASGMLSYTLAETTWAILEIGLHQQPFPSLADVFYLMFYPLFAIGIIFLPSDQAPLRERVKIIIDIIIIMISGALIFSNFLIGPILARGEESSLALTLSLAYPILDLVLLFALMELLYRRKNSLHMRPMLLLFVAVTIMIASDIIFGVQSSSETYASGGASDTGFVISYSLIGLAGILQANEWKLHPRDTSAGSRSIYEQSSWIRYLPYTAVIISYLLLIWNQSHSLIIDPFITTLGVGGIIGLVLVRQNITLDENTSLYIESRKEINERKLVENELRESRNELEQRVSERTEELESRNAEMERFIYTVSHDLRTPLVGISGFLGFLKQDAEKGDLKQLETDLNTIGNSISKMDQLLGETLELSRIGRVTNPPEDVLFGEMVEEALDQAAERIRLRGIKVIVAQDLPKVHVDRMRIVEVLGNLIENSVKYLGDQSQPQIEIGYRLDEGQTVLFVRDNGIGIEPSQQDKVFELFYKVDRKSEGTGAGLAIVKRIIEVHGGRIWIESKLGKGSTVCFTLPLADSQ